MSQGLPSNGFNQLVTEATHIRGGHIDRAYWRDVWGDRYSPYYSDHDGICTTLTKKVRATYNQLIFLIVFTEQPTSTGRVT